jgi:hypothetical protein
MTPSPERVNTAPAPSSHTEKSRWPAAVIVVLLCLFALAMYQRNSIRAYWWASRLVDAEDLRSRAYYIAALAAVGDSAAGAIHRLAHDARPEVRALAIPSLARLSERFKLAELSSLLADADVEVRDSAATALAFTGGDAATRILIDRAQSDQSRAAASAVAALARLSSPQVLTTLCNVVASHPDPYVRAQAVESLAACAVPEATDERSRTSRSQAACDPVLVLVSSLEDQALFDGQLALEEQIAAVTTAVSPSALPPSDKTTRLHLDTPVPSRSVAQRTVADVAAHWLSMLTGRQVRAGLGRTPNQQAELAGQCRRWMAQRRQGTPSADSLPAEAPRADYADTPSEVDQPN